MKHIAIDTMVLIYLFEWHPKYADKVESLLESVDKVTFSALGVGELLAGVEKSRKGDAKLNFLAFVQGSEKLTVRGFGMQEALTFAELRAKYPKLKSPDMIHLACAIRSGAESFVTNDKALKIVEEISVVLL